MAGNGATATASGRAESTIINAVPGLCERGAPILPCDGKRPIHDGWQHRTYAADEVAAELRRVANPMIGLRFGPGSCIDIEADSADEERVFAELFDGCEVPITPTFKSTRGKHRLFAWDDRLSQTAAAVVSYRGTNGAKLGIRIGAGDKGAQSIIPPSPGREWLVSWDDCEPAALPDVVIGRILAAANPKPNPQPAHASTNGHATPAALAAMLRHKPDANESDGSKRLFAIACRAVEHALDDAAAVATIREYEQRHPFPTGWSDADITRRIRDAEKKTVRGSEKVEASKADPASVATKFRESLCFDGICRLVFYRSEFLFWERGAYRPLNDDDLRARLVEFHARDYRNVKQSHIGNALEHLRSQCLVSAHIDAPAWLSATKHGWAPLECISTKSGIVHLPSYAAKRECLLPATPRFFTTTGVDYPFDHEAPAPVHWLQFLDSLWGDDWQSIATLREFFGYCLTPDTSQQKLLLIVGPKRSGKGTILRILRALVGPMNVAAPTLSSLCERFGGWPLLGKSVAVVSDARLSGRADQAVIVERVLSITGEDAQTIDRKNMQPVTVKLPTRFVIVTNELPRLGDASGALVSRMILLRTLNSFYGCEDHGLTDRLLGELPGILLWAIGGWQSLRERGRFVQPESSQQLLNELTDLSSPIGAFVREWCEVDPQATVEVDALYAEWRRWCEQSGKVRPTDKATFGRDLVAILPTVQRTRPRHEDGQRVYVYVGIGLDLDPFRS